MVCTAVSSLGQSQMGAALSGSLPTPSVEQSGVVSTRPMYETPSQVPLAARPQVVSTPQAASSGAMLSAPSAERSYPSVVPYEPVDDRQSPDHGGSAYIPVDSWVYPAMTRLYSMGFLDSIFLGMRPWTRRSALHMLLLSENAIVASDNAEAQGILDKLLHELRLELRDPRGAVYGVESGYTRLMGINGTTLRDSYHLGQTSATTMDGRTSRVQQRYRLLDAERSGAVLAVYARGVSALAGRGGILSGAGFAAVATRFICPMLRPMRRRPRFLSAR